MTNFGSAMEMPWKCRDHAMKSQGLLCLFDSTVGSSHSPDGSASNGEECFRLCIATEVAPSSTERIPKECYIVWWLHANISKYLQMPWKCHESMNVTQPCLEYLGAFAGWGCTGAGWGADTYEFWSSVAMCFCQKLSPNASELYVISCGRLKPIIFRMGLGWRLPVH